ERQETLHLGQVAAVEDRDVALPVRAGPGDDVGPAVAVEVAGRHEHAAAEVRPVGVEAGQFHPGDDAEDLDVRVGPRPRPGDDVGDAVAVEVAGRHPHPAGEPRVVGHEADERGQVPAAEGLDVRPAADVGAGDDVGEAV